MGLSKANEKILVDLVTNKEHLMAHVDEICEDLNLSEMRDMISRFSKLKDEGYITLMPANNKIYNVQLKPDGIDYVEDNGLLVELFTKDILLDIIRSVGSKHGHIYPTIWGIKGGSESIEWHQLDEQEWEVRIGVVADIPEVKQIGREIIEAMESHSYIVESIENDDSRPRFEQTIKFIHKSIYQTEQSYLSGQVTESSDFDTFFSDLKNSCLSLQSFGAINKKASGEDVKTQYIRNSLHDKGYNADDQTQRGASATGIQAGEVDLLVNNENMIPVIMIEALVLESVTAGEIKLHIDKMTNYDTAGLPRNILLVYTYTADFGDFIRRYTRHINEFAQLKYPLLNLTDISSDEHSEFRVLASTYIRSDRDRELLHVFVNLPRG